MLQNTMKKKSDVMEKVSGGLVLYKTPSAVFTRVIDSFFSNPCADELVISDNSPTRELKGFLEQQYSALIDSGRLLYLALPENPGYGAAQNHCFRNRRGMAKYHVVLNPDLYFGAETFGKLIEFMVTDSLIGHVMPRIEYPDGRIQYLCKRLPTPWDVFARRFIQIPVIREKMAYNFENRSFGYDKALNVPYLSGCFMFLRSDVFKNIGMFDERYFMYPEDIDLTRRIHEYYKTMYCPSVVVVHDHARESYKSAQMVFVHIVNMCRYFNKWGWFHDPGRREMNRKLAREIQAG